MNSVEILLAIADRIEAHRCSECDGHNDHEVCIQPDFARILREVAKQAERGFVMPPASKTEMNGRIKGTIIKVGTINADGTLGTGWVIDGNGGRGVEIDDEVYICGYTLAELKKIAEGSCE